MSRDTDFPSAGRMGPATASHTRTRARRSAESTIEIFEDLDNDELAQDVDEEPPRKRIRTARSSRTRHRWVPGGRGGGGRHRDGEDGKAMVNNKTTKEYQGSRRRRVRETTFVMGPTTPRYSARSRNRGGARSRYSTAAAASAAAAHSDGYKPREERGWEEFHPELDLGLHFAVIESEDVDGIAKEPMFTPSGDNQVSDLDMDGAETPNPRTPSRKRAGRPPRNRDSMLNSLLIPEPPKVIPMPGPNPRERLTLPKPSYRELDPFLSYESKDIASVNFVDKTMAHVGYQEGEIYLRPEKTLIRQMEGSAEEDLDLNPSFLAEGENAAIGGTGVGRVEYDMDEQDVRWLEALNKTRVKDGVQAIKPAVFEITMTKVEKEWHALEKRIPKPNPKAPQTQRPRSSSAAAVNGEPAPGEEPDSKCAICDDGDCENANAIVFCDGCDLAVHQECYGVPYIPEGQWLCRKCQLVGNARPSCIFCPLEGGAFKQTNNSKWAHLLCATWIPEVSIGNPSLMEPITDVEKVPPSRWKLGCYICHQSMGASIQCSDGRCYEPFHLTCARQAGLYLRMKTGGGQNTLMELSQLRAYCHKHTPSDWRHEHQTDKTFERAKTYLKDHFRGQVWADSRASALSIGETQDVQTAEKGPLKVVLTNKKGQKPKTVWRLPSGAPIIPEVVLKSIEDSLVRFTVQKKKEYATEVCKYWSLKREARRGAALLKRLQLQMDTFSSFEVTRRDYKAQGAAGRLKLEKRIDFAATLVRDLERIRDICGLVKQRETEKLTDGSLLKSIIDTVYFPIMPLLEPIIEKVLRHDTRHVYRERLLVIRSKVAQRTYTAVAPFSADLAQVLTSTLSVSASSIADLQSQIGERVADLKVEERDARTLARRLIKVVQPGLIDAFQKESELTGRPYAQEMKEMEVNLSRRGSLSNSADLAMTDAVLGDEPTNGLQANLTLEEDMQAIEDRAVGDGKLNDTNGLNGLNPAADGDIFRNAEQIIPLKSLFTARENDQVPNAIASHTPPASTHEIKHFPLSATKGKDVGRDLQSPPTPPMSLQEQQQIALTHGGIPWYVEQFDPVGTTVYDERWTGREVLRSLSEDLSEMDEEELEGLGAANFEEPATNDPVEESANEEISPQKKVTQKSKKIKRGNDWGTRSFRNRRR